MRGCKMKKAGVMILATILMVTLMAIGSNAAEGPKSIIIGALVSMTGPDALTGQPSKHGYQLGADMINAQGGCMLSNMVRKYLWNWCFRIWKQTRKRLLAGQRL